MAPRAIVAGMEASGEVVQVLPEWSPPPLELRVVFPSRRGLPSRVRLFVDLLAEQGAAQAAAENLPRNAL